MAAYCNKFIPVVFIAHAKSSKTGYSTAFQKHSFSEYHYKTVRQNVYLFQEQHDVIFLVNRSWIF